MVLELKSGKAGQFSAMQVVSTLSVMVTVVCDFLNIINFLIHFYPYILYVRVFTLAIARVMHFFHSEILR